MRREWLLVLLALGLAAVAGAVVYLSRPTTLTVAVGPRDGSEAVLLEAYSKALARNREDIRLNVLPLDDVEDSAVALQENRADLAVVRPDVKLPDNGLTLAVLHDESLIVATPQPSDIDSFTDLSKHRLGVLVRHKADLAFINHLLEFYDFEPATSSEAALDKTLAAGRVGIVPLKASEVKAALDEKRVDAVAVIAAPASKAAVSVVRAVGASSPDHKVTLVNVPDGKAIIQRFPELQPISIPAGTFGGRPSLPDEDVETLGISYRLMARGSVSRIAVASVTQHLFEWRPRLAAATPLANQIKAPDYETTVTATSARLPNHPGAVDYFEREQQTFIQRYEDWVYLVAFFGGTIGSGFAWLGQRLARKRRERVDGVLDRLLEILAEVRAATDAAALDAIGREMDGLVADVVRQTRERALDTRVLSALILAIDAVHAALEDARRSIGVTPPLFETTGAARTRTARLLSLSFPAAE
ncbi:TAXI family TRAP transporter solute-binding subunit [Methylobacterium gnaphalii]|nr:TAXI family TRAP transporter solute-binding subunit [Methylobacterium gnaphalii]